MPSWAGGKVPVNVNGVVAATGTSGSYVEIDRSWSNHDTVSFELPMEFRLVKYTGFDQDANHDRYAVLRGPLLMALVGATDLNIASGELRGRLAPVANNPLSFSVAGSPNCRYLPYWEIQGETFTCFPTMR